MLRSRLLQDCRMTVSPLPVYQLDPGMGMPTASTENVLASTAADGRIIASHGHVLPILSCRQSGRSFRRSLDPDHHAGAVLRHPSFWRTARCRAANIADGTGAASQAARARRRGVHRGQTQGQRSPLPVDAGRRGFSADRRVDERVGPALGARSDRPRRPRSGNASSGECGGRYVRPKYPRKALSFVSISAASPSPIAARAIGGWFCARRHRGLPQGSSWPGGRYCHRRRSRDLHQGVARLLRPADAIESGKSRCMARPRATTVARRLLVLPDKPTLKNFQIFSVSYSLSGVAADRRTRGVTLYRRSANIKQDQLMVSLIADIALAWRE